MNKLKVKRTIVIDYYINKIEDEVLIEYGVLKEWLTDRDKNYTSIYETLDVAFTDEHIVTKYDDIK